MRNQYFPQSQVNEVEDNLPEEVTALIFAQLSPLDLMKSCELVCRKWKRITNQTSLWEDTISLWQNSSSPFDTRFYFKPNQPLTLEIKREICHLLR